MISARDIGLGMVIAGLVVGTATDRIPVRQVLRAGGYLVLAGDFHVHAFFGDGGLAPWELAREARRVGLDVITVTNHNQLLAGRIAESTTGGDAGPIVLVGQEITAPRFHMIAVGIRRTIEWHLSAVDAIRAVHDQGGVAIAAHPVRQSWHANDDDALRLLDGVEVAHPLMLINPTEGMELVEFYEATSQRNASLAAIGSSDFHFGGTLGLCRTFLFVKEISPRGVVEAIREGRTVAFDGRDRLIGDPALVQLLRAMPGAIDTGRPISSTPKAAAWLVLLGLFLMILLGKKQADRTDVRPA